MGGEAPSSPKLAQVEQVSTGLAQVNRYQEQVAQVSSTIIESIITESRGVAQRVTSIGNTSSKEIGKKPVLPVLPVLASGFFDPTCANPVLPVLDSDFSEDYVVQLDRAADVVAARHREAEDFLAQVVGAM